MIPSCPRSRSLIARWIVTRCTGQLEIAHRMSASRVSGRHRHVRESPPPPLLDLAPRLTWAWLKRRDDDIRVCPCAGEVLEGGPSFARFQRVSISACEQRRSFSLWPRACAAPSERVRFFFPKDGQAPRGGAPCVVVHLEEA